MKDAFGNKIDIGSTVLYCSDARYTIGKIVKLCSCENYQLDRVALKVIKSSEEGVKFTKDPIIYASNVVKFDLN